MMVFNFKRRFLLLAFLALFYIATTSLVLSGCGGGGGGSSSSSPSQQNTAPSTPTVTAYNNVMYIYLDDYADEDAPNIPYVYIYINGDSTPIPLLLDTGATGILINQSALNNAGIDTSSMSEANSFSVTFGDTSTASGYVNNVSVYTAASGSGLGAQNIPIAIATSDNAFPSTGFLQGDFGMGLSPYYSFGQSGGTVYTPSFPTAVSNNNYNNGFILNFQNITFTNGYDILDNPKNNPVGTITFGLNTESDNAVPAGAEFYPNLSQSGNQYSFPLIPSEFGSSTSDSNSYEFYSFFDTGSNFIFLGTDALDDAVGGAASTNDVISSGSCQSLVYGGLNVDFSLLNNSSSHISNNFITEPDNSTDNSFCDYTAVTNVINSSNNNALAFQNAVSYGGSQKGQEDLGLPFVYDNIIYWQAQTGSQSWGIGVE